MDDLTLIKQHTPFAQYQMVTVQFGTEHTDTEVRHTLRPATPEHIGYLVVSQAQAGTVYHDMTGTRKAWRPGVLTLRSSIANARVTLLLFVTHEPQTLIEKSPANPEGVSAEHEHDAADITSGTLDAARIPSLDASKIGSGTIDLARISDLTDAEIAALAAIAWSKISKTGSSLADLATRSAGDLSSGTLPDGRFPATLPAASGANLTDIPETAIADGSVLARVAADETITGDWTFEGELTFSSRPRCESENSGTQSIAHNTATAVEFDVDNYDVGDMHDTGSNPSRFVAPVAGVYLVIINVTFAGHATGIRQLWLSTNGDVAGGDPRYGSVRVDAVGNATSTQLNAVGLINMAANDYVEGYVIQTSGGNLNIGSTQENIKNRFMAIRVA